MEFGGPEMKFMPKIGEYYSFYSWFLLGLGLVFQVPVVILGATRSGLVTPQQLRKNRRYAILACAVIAAFLPGDAITLVLETVPLYLLYEASILLAVFVGRSRRVRGQQQPSPAEGPGEPAGEPQPPNDSPEPQTVQQIIDHVDRDLSG